MSRLLSFMFGEERYSVVTFYDYVLAIWLRLAASCPAQQMLVDLREYLEVEYQIIEIYIADELESDSEDELTVSLRLQVTFDKSQMEGDDPSEESIEKLDRELRAYLEAKYQVTYLEVLDDALTSHLLAERDEPEERKYPMPKQRELTDDEKSQLRTRIEGGEADIYALAAEFECSASQVAGIKAAMHR